MRRGVRENDVIGSELGNLLCSSQIASSNTSIIQEPTSHSLPSSMCSCLTNKGRFRPRIGVTEGGAGILR